MVFILRGDKLVGIALGAKILHRDFVEKSVSINQNVLRAGAIFGIIIELFNIFRILIYPGNDLTLIGDQIYFGFCLLYFTCCLLFCLRISIVVCLLRQDIKFM